MLLNKLQRIPADPILSIGREFQLSQHPKKVDLAIGLYQDDLGDVTIFPSVKAAEKQLWDKETTKRYTPSFCDKRFIELLPKVLLGVDNILENFAVVATPGGCGALALAGQVLDSCDSQVKIWMSDPSWANHKPIFQFPGWEYGKIDYIKDGVLHFEGVLQSLDRAQADEVILLQASCHNPTGIDFEESQLQQLVDIIKSKRLFPIIDCAYIGMGESIERDSKLVRLILDQVPECAVTISCSKIFSLYNERTGILLFKTENNIAIQSHLNALLRRSYSISPYHGTGIVAELLTTEHLHKKWLQELSQATAHIQRARKLLISALADNGIDFSFMANNKGMFSMLGLSQKQCQTLRQQHQIYLLDDSRINVVGIREQNIEYVVKSIVKVLDI